MVEVKLKMEFRKGIWDRSRESLYYATWSGYRAETEHNLAPNVMDRDYE
jgi:hypothetical protein